MPAKGKWTACMPEPLVDIGWPAPRPPARYGVLGSGPVYLGRTGNLRDRLWQHLTGNGDR